MRRHLANDDVSGARRLAAEAIRRSPSSVEAYRRLVGTLLPWSAKRVLTDVTG